MDAICETDLISMGFGSNPGDIKVLVDNCGNENPRFRQFAISALVRRRSEFAFEEWLRLATDDDWHVRRRIAELGIDFGEESTKVLLKLATDDSVFVQEMSCFALGEIFEDSQDTIFDSETLSLVIQILIDNAAHDNPLVRESAIASLGNIGDERAKSTIISGCSDKAPIRRRAVVALAAFEGHEVESALDIALNDVDWQVRQAAEDISGKKSPRE